VLIAGLVAACFGSAAIGWLDPFSLLVRSFGLSILPAFNAAARAVLTPLEHSHIAAIKATGETLHTILHYTVLDLRQPHYCAGPRAGHSVHCDSCGQPARDAAVVPGDLPAGRAAGRGLALVVLGLHKDAAACDKCNRCLLTARAATIPSAACRGARPSA
jgi:hypothetical protein